MLRKTNNSLFIATPIAMITAEMKTAREKS